MHLHFCLLKDLIGDTFSDPENTYEGNTCAPDSLRRGSREKVYKVLRRIFLHLHSGDWRFNLHSKDREMAAEGQDKSIGRLDSRSTTA